MKILITGGMGFVGLNAAMHFANKGHRVFVLDNLNKVGLLKHIDTIKRYGITLIKGDIREWNDVERALKTENFQVVIHLAGQTAVTHSVEDPINDFQHNAVGTFNVLEATRQFAGGAKFIFNSTNKVYGNLTRYIPIEGKTQWRLPIESIDESEPLDFFSPYGVSKGCGDQYVRDYHRIYGLNTNVLRCSCLYGPYQDGTEDQGWVAWFIKAFLEKKPITIFGDGKQVRDLLHVSDLVNFYETLLIKDRPGEVYNMGGGPDNVISLLELIDHLKDRIGDKTDISFAEERPGDQKVFISNNNKALKLGWKPKIGFEKGIDMLITHFMDNKS